MLLLSHLFDLFFQILHPIQDAVDGLKHRIGQVVRIEADHLFNPFSFPVGDPSRDAYHHRIWRDILQDHGP